MNKAILLIRHAQSANNALPESQRVPDPGLTQLGQQQAENLAIGLSRFPVTELYCSPFRRSLDTTRPVSHALKLKPKIHADIYEQGGCYRGFESGRLRGCPGMTRAELEQLYPEWSIDDAIGENGWNHGRNYETETEVFQRALRVAKWLTEDWASRSKNELAALVIHADFKRILLEALMKTDRWPHHWQPIYNTSVTHLSYEEDGWRMIAWNSVDHLDVNLMSA